VKCLGPLFLLEMNLLNTISFKKVIESFRNAKSSDETRHMRKAERRNHFIRHCMRKVIKKVHFNFSKVETNKKYLTPPVKKIYLYEIYSSN
jgi:high-affinity nickel permease